METLGHDLATITDIRRRHEAEAAHKARGDEWSLSAENYEVLFQDRERLLEHIAVIGSRFKGVGKLVEEMGEVGQLLGKAIAFPDGPHPDGLGPIIKRLPDELADMKAAVHYVEKVNSVRVDYLREHEKYAKFLIWGLAGV